MIARLKKSRFGQVLCRVSQNSLFGWPLKIAARAVQSEAVQPAHFLPSHRAHNTRQERLLSDFERSLKARS